MASLWRKRLRTASFRKIRFEYVAADSTFGRRIAGHEFPKRDEPYSEDLGRRARDFTIDAYIVGWDYQRQRDRLIAACEQPGPGRLVHPYYGNRDVVCTECSVRESGQEGGMARFQLTFREAGSLLFPQIKRKAKGILSLLGADIEDQAVTDFTDNFSVAGLPQALVDSATDKVGEFCDALETSISFITRNADEIADLAFSIQSLRDDLQSIIDTPSVLATRITTALGLVSSSVTDKTESLRAHQGFFAFGSDDPGLLFETSNRLQERENLRAINAVIRRSALQNAASDIVQVTYASVQEAHAARQTLFDAIDTEQNSDQISDDMYQFLADLRATLARSVPPEDESLPNIVDIQTKQTTNSIVLAYELYGTTDRELDLVDRNNFRNPGEIMGGETVEALRDA